MTDEFDHMLFFFIIFLDMCFLVIFFLGALDMSWPEASPAGALMAPPAGAAAFGSV